MKNFVPAPVRRHAVPWAIAITLAGFVTGGGIAAAVTMGGTTAAPAQTGQADLTTLLAASASAPATASDKPVRALGRLRRAGGMYGTITYRGKDGVDHTLAFERGTIVSASSTSVAVRAPDGTSMTWLIMAGTVVRERGAKATTAELQAGEQVFTGGPVVNGARDARLIVIRATTSGTS